MMDIYKRFIGSALSPPQNPIEKYFVKITRYHYFSFACLYATKLPVFWHVLSLIFTSPPMTYLCTDNDTPEGCPCENAEWNRSVFTETIQTKYKLLCERKWLISFSQCTVYVGTLLGALTFGIMADKYGRLAMFSLSCVFISVPGMLVVFMPNIYSFWVMRGLEGMGVGGSIVTGYVLIVEYCGTNYREMVTALYHVPINVSHMTLPGISYLFRNCDHLQIVISIPALMCILVQVFLYESPKWLIDNNNIPRATIVMQKIAKFNKHNPDIIKAEMNAYFASYTKQTQQRMGFFVIFRHRNLTRNLVCMAGTYYVCGMGYYGVSQYIGKMSGDIHENVAVSGALLIPGTVIASFLIKILGRRTFLMSSCFLSGVFMIGVVLIPPSHPHWRVFVAAICNCFFFISFIIVFLYGVELFPTTIRNSALGFLSLCSRVGQISAPPINSLPETVSGVIFGALAFLGGLLCIPLPETKGKELPSTIEDSKAPAKK